MSDSVPSASLPSLDVYLSEGIEPAHPSPAIAAPSHAAAAIITGHTTDGGPGASKRPRLASAPLPPQQPLPTEAPRVSRTRRRTLVSWNCDALHVRNDPSRFSKTTGRRKGGLLPKYLLQCLDGVVPDLIGLQETWTVFDPVRSSGNNLRTLLRDPVRLSADPDDTGEQQQPGPVRVRGMLNADTTSLLPREWVPQFCHCYWACNTKASSGVAVLSRTKPLSVEWGFPGLHPEFASEARYICLELAGCFVVNIYAPNSGNERLDMRAEGWDQPLRAHLRVLSARRPVICFGDFNVCHLEIDVTHPEFLAKQGGMFSTKARRFIGNREPRYKPHAGMRALEREGFTKLLEAGLIDSFRELYPRKREYSWRSQTVRPTSTWNGVGMRLDYFLVSEALRSQLIAATMFDGRCDGNPGLAFCGSDHCPITLTLELTGWDSDDDDAANDDAHAGCTALESESGASASTAFDAATWIRQFRAACDGSLDRQRLRRQIADQTVKVCRQQGGYRYRGCWVTLPQDYMDAMLRAAVVYRQCPTVDPTPVQCWWENGSTDTRGCGVSGDSGAVGACRVDVVRDRDSIDVALALKNTHENLNPVCKCWRASVLCAGCRVSSFAVSVWRVHCVIVGGVQVVLHLTTRRVAEPEDSTFLRTSYCQSAHKSGSNQRQQKQQGLSATYSPGVLCFRSSEATGYDFLPAPLSLAFIDLDWLAERSSTEHMWPSASEARNKLEAALTIGLEHGHDAIVLSALDCGAHAAWVFHELLGEATERVEVRGSSLRFRDRYKRVVFAVESVERGSMRDNDDVAASFERYFPSGTATGR